jgi:hypothetical protein
MDRFETFMATEMLPAECDDERVKVGMQLCWNAALEYAAEIAEANNIGVRARMGVTWWDYGVDVADAIREKIHE